MNDNEKLSPPFHSQKKDETPSLVNWKPHLSTNSKENSNSLLKLLHCFDSRFELCELLL